jgi:hypothetical protein
MALGIAIGLVIFAVSFFLFYRAEKRRQEKLLHERSRIPLSVRWGVIFAALSIVVVVLAAMINGVSAAGLVPLVLVLGTLFLVSIAERRRRERAGRY